MQIGRAAFLLTLAACALPPTVPDDAPPEDITTHVATSVSGSAQIVEFSGQATGAATVSEPLGSVTVAAYRVARAGDPGAVYVSTVPISAFWGVPVGSSRTRPDGTFTIDGIGQGLHIVMLTEEPRRGGCIGQAGMLRFVRVIRGVPTDPISLSY